MSIYTFILTGGSNNHQTTSEDANALATDFVPEGVVGAITNTSGVAPMTGAFAVNAQGTPDMTVAVSAGVAYVQATPSGQASQMLRVYNNASANVTIAANSSGSTKYDWVYISISAANAANPNVAGDNVATLVTSRSSSATTDDGTPPSYGYPLAVVTVANAASSITNGNITDIRELTGAVAASLDTVRQNDTTNVTENGAKVLTGWGRMTNNTGAANISETVTFKSAFTSAPIVVAICGGDSVAGTTYGSGGNNITGRVSTKAHTVTTTGFTIQVHTGDGANFGAGNTFYQWIAIGK